MKWTPQNKQATWFNLHFPYVFWILVCTTFQICKWVGQDWQKQGKLDFYIPRESSFSLLEFDFPCWSSLLDVNSLLRILFLVCALHFCSVLLLILFFSSLSVHLSIQLFQVSLLKSNTLKNTSGNYWRMEWNICTCKFKIQRYGATRRNKKNADVVTQGTSRSEWVRLNDDSWLRFHRVIKFVLWKVTCIFIFEEIWINSDNCVDIS